MAATYWNIVETYWIIPAGMIALYFYGMFHFNSLTYILDLGSLSGSSEIQGVGARLITPAPPIYTASRTHFNRYARRYVLILEAAFIVIISFYSILSGVLSDTKGMTRLDINLIFPSEAQTLQHRALWALFTLTGLLSSFPGFKELDNWLLGTLHKAAFIPDEVRVLARTLYDAPLSVPPSSVVALREKLDMPNSRSFSDESQIGRLERRVLEIFSLRNQLQSRMEGGRYTSFKIRLDRDLQEIARQNEGLKAEIKAYIRDQDKLLEQIASPSRTNVDTFISNNLGNLDVAELYERRKLLELKCDVLYQTMCLLTALCVFATETDPDSACISINNIGFAVSQTILPPLDWDCVAKAIFSTFLLMITVNASYSLFSHVFGFTQVLREVDPDAVKTQVIKFATLFTIVYSSIMIFVVKIKRKWLMEAEGGAHHRGFPQNLLVGIICYFVSLVLYNTPFSYYMRGEFTLAPFLFALNQGLLAYFVGMYFDDSAQDRKLSLTRVKQSPILTI